MAPTPADLRRQLLSLTLEQARTKRAIDLLRNVIDAEARHQYEAEHEAPTWKTRDLGAIRFDAPDPEPVAYVTNGDAFVSWVAETQPTEVEATITVSVDKLAAAVDALQFAGITGSKPALTLRPGTEERILKSVDLVNLADDDAEPDWRAVNTETGVEVPGIGQKPPAAGRLVVTVDPAAKKALLAEVDAEYAPLLEQTPAAAADAAVPMERSA